MEGGERGVQEECNRSELEGRGCNVSVYVGRSVVSWEKLKKKAEDCERN